MPRPLVAALLVPIVLTAPGTTARAQAPLGLSGFTAVPSFAWPQPAASPAWDGSFARMSTGFQVASSRRLGTVAGPTVGFEGGRMWRDGDVVYGVTGGFDYLSVLGGYPNPGFGRIGYTRDFAAGAQVKAGTLVTENVLLYTKAGLSAVNETYWFGPTSISPLFRRQDIAVRPDARVGAEWAITDRLSVGVEVGVTGPAIR